MSYKIIQYIPIPKAVALFFHLALAPPHHSSHSINLWLYWFTSYNWIFANYVICFTFYQLCHTWFVWSICTVTIIIVQVFIWNLSRSVKALESLFVIWLILWGHCKLFKGILVYKQISLHIPAHKLIRFILNCN